MDTTEIEIVKNMTDMEKLRSLRAALRQAHDLIDPFDSVTVIFDASRPIDVMEGAFSRGVWFGEIRTYIEQAQDALRRAGFKVNRFLETIDSKETD